MDYSVKQALKARPDTNYGLSISEMDVSTVLQATRYIEMSAGLKAMSISGLLKPVPISKVGVTRLKRRLGTVRRNMDRLVKWADETAPVSRVEVVVVARSIWVSLKGVKAHLELVIEQTEMSILSERELRGAMRL